MAAAPKTKITALAVLKWNGLELTPTFLGFASDVSEFGFFQKPSVQEMLRFVSRTLVQRTPPGKRQTVEHEGYLCHVYNADGLGAIAVCTRDYPTRAAFSVLNAEIDRFCKAYGDTWRGQREDTAGADAQLQEAIRKYQDPANADQLTKIQRDLDDTKIILHKTIESVLERGARLDDLVAKSHDLSMASQLFYRQARKSNSCCQLM